MQLFFDENIHEIGEFQINEQEALHITKVLRLKEGDIIKITNGKGYLFEAKLLEISKKNTIVKILNKTFYENERKNKLHIAIAPTKSIDRFEWFVEKAVEIGIDRITPIISRYSERKVLKIERIEKVIISAMKQSIKFNKPKLDTLTSFSEFVKNANAENKFIAFCKADTNIKSIKPKNSNLFIVGPEGGFADFEIQLAEQNNFKPLLISDYRLRTETAGVFINTAFNVLF